MLASYQSSMFHFDPLHSLVFGHFPVPPVDPSLKVDKEAGQALFDTKVRLIPVVFLYDLSHLSRLTSARLATASIGTASSKATGTPVPPAWSLAVRAVPSPSARSSLTM